MSLKRYNIYIRMELLIFIKEVLKLQVKERRIIMEKVNYTSYGEWEITTEGDCEGRSVRNLGIFEGYIDEIAFALADKACYVLQFSRVQKNIPLDMTPKRNKVNIMLNIDSGTWDMKNEERIDYFKNLFKDRDIEVLNGTSYASVIISSEQETLEEKRKKILAKLSPEEKHILGL